MTSDGSSLKLDRCFMPIKNDTEEEAKEYFLNTLGYIEALIVTMAISCLSLLLMIWAVWVIYRQKRMSSLVRKYFFVEYASRLYLILFFQLYINPLLFWPEEIGKTPAFIDTLITYLYSVFTLSCPFAQMALSGNRFLAVAFNGRFYYLMSQRETLQVVILIVAPLLLHFPQLLPSCSPYNTDCYGEVGFGGYCPQIAWIAVFAASIFGLITIIMDICVWRMLKKRRKDAHLLNNPGEKTERRLCRHMLLNHVSTLIIGLIVSIISGSLTNDELLQAVIQTNLHVPIAAVVQGFILIWFLQSYRCCASKGKLEMASNEEKMRTTRAVSMSAPISRQNVIITKMSIVQL